MNDNPTAAWWCHIRETACSVQDLQSKLKNIPASVWEYYENDHQAIEVNAEKEKFSTFLFPLLWEDQPVMHAYVGGRTPRTRVLPHHPSYIVKELTLSDFPGTELALSRLLAFDSGIMLSKSNNALLFADDWPFVRREALFHYVSGRMADLIDSPIKKTRVSPRPLLEKYARMECGHPLATVEALGSLCATLADMNHLLTSLQISSPGALSLPVLHDDLPYQSR